MQKILSSKNNYIELENYLQESNYKKILLVCTHSFYKSNLYKKIEEISNNTIFIVFNNFKKTFS